jgi:hypothetical protein
MPAPPLTEAEVAAAEREFGVVFPREYRDFLLTVSAGGGRITTLVPGPDGWFWAGDDRTDPGRLAEPFRDREAMRQQGAELAAREPSQDCRPVEWQAWDDECAVVHARETAGALFLSTDGVSDVWLAISGPHAGTLWFDMRATADLIVPLTSPAGRPLTFSEWCAADERALYARLYRVG